MDAAEFDGLLNAHAYLRVERPPEPWTPAAGLEPFTRMLGELIVAGLARNGGVLAALTLNVSDAVVGARSQLGVGSRRRSGRRRAVPLLESPLRRRGLGDGPDAGTRLDLSLTGDGVAVAHAMFR